MIPVPAAHAQRRADMTQENNRNNETIITVLMDNEAQPGLTGEWGLSVLVEHEGRRILLDCGKSGAFAANAAALGIDLAEVDYGVLSHAHYDHADGMETFFSLNDRACFCLRREAGEDCYDLREGERYIGIRKGTLEQYARRIRKVEGEYPLCPGVTLVPHKGSGLDEVGKRACMYRKGPQGWKADDFSHEQSLVVETAKGLVILNSCSHGGADRIIREVADTFPGKSIYAILGGFHLFRSTPAQVRALARGIRDTGIERVITGHCTGQEAYAILERELGDRLEQMCSGYVLRIGCPDNDF